VPHAGTDAEAPATRSYPLVPHQTACAP